VDQNTGITQEEKDNFTPLVVDYVHKLYLLDEEERNAHFECGHKIAIDEEMKKQM